MVTKLHNHVGATNQCLVGDCLSEELGEGRVSASRRIPTTCVPDGLSAIDADSRRSLQKKSKGAEISLTLATVTSYRQAKETVSRGVLVSGVLQRRQSATRQSDGVDDSHAPD